MKIGAILEITASTSFVPSPLFCDIASNIPLELPKSSFSISIFILLIFSRVLKFDRRLFGFNEAAADKPRWLIICSF